MPDHQTLLERADQLVETDTGSVLSQVQRLVLIGSFTENTKTKTYDQIAAEAGYSCGYIKVIAAELWKLLSNAIGKKVTKGTVQTILQQQLRYEPPEPLPPQASLADATAIAPGPEQRTITPPSPQQQPTTPEAKTPKVQEREDNRTRRAAILVVDDQPRNIALLTDIMENNDYEVWQASNGAEALAMATRVLPDLILLDVNMPDLDGYTVCQQLKTAQQTAAIPIIFVSASDGSWDKVKGFSVGGSDYITKPFNTLDVIVRIENQLQIRQIQDQIAEQGIQPQATAAPHPTASLESERPSSKAIILMVDDEPKNLTLLADVLEQEGYEVWQADCGSEALRIATMVLPDLILLDINLPDISGYDVCQHLKVEAETKLIPVIFVSALNETWDKS